MLLKPIWPCQSRYRSVKLKKIACIVYSYNCFQNICIGLATVIDNFLDGKDVGCMAPFSHLAIVGSDLNGPHKEGHARYS